MIQFVIGIDEMIDIFNVPFRGAACLLINIRYIQNEARAFYWHQLYRHRQRAAWMHQ